MSVVVDSRCAQIAERARAVIPGGVNSNTRLNGEPLSIASTEGAYVTDADGKRYLDYHAAFGAILLGHRDPVVEEAVSAAREVLDLTGYGVAESEVALAELVTSILPAAEQMITLNTGSEAVAYALRIARAHTGRRLIVKFQGGFHGWSDSVARNVISPADRAWGWDPMTAGVLDEVLEATLIAEFNDLDSVRALFEAHPEQIAAVILEPIPHNVGALLPTQEFADGLRELTRQQGALLIFDEVITGFRHALGGYQSIVGVTPDLTTFGKAMGNGYPVAGVGGSREVMQVADWAAGGTVAIMGTFNGNPSACAAGIATVTYLQGHPEFYERTHAFGQQIRDGLQGIFDEAGVSAQLAGFGACFTTYFLRDHEGPIRGYRDLLANDAAASTAFHRGMIDRGFLMIPMPMKRMHVSGRHTQADIDATLTAAAEVVAELAAKGEVPRR